MKIPITIESGDGYLLFVGGGQAALSKVRVLSRLAIAQQARLRLRLVAPDIAAGLESLPGLEIELVRRAFEPGDISAADPPLLVYTFTGLPEMDAEVARLAARLRIPVNGREVAADGIQFSSPAIAAFDGFLATAASLSGPERTRGADPAAARRLLEKLEAVAGRQVEPDPKRAGPASAGGRVPPYMPFMIGIRRALVFAGERGEGLQKAEKLALYAGEVVVVSESDPATWTAESAGGRWRDKQTGSSAKHIVFGPGPTRFVDETLAFAREVEAEVLPHAAAYYTGSRRRLRNLLAGFDFICSDLSDEAANLAVHAEATRLGIRHTVIDTKQLSDTWFMSLIDAGSLVAGISSRGGAAFYTRKLREELTAEFFARAPLGDILNRVREESPVDLRRRVLETVWADGDFQNLVGGKDYEGALARAQELARELADEGSVTAPAPEP